MVFSSLFPASGPTVLPIHCAALELAGFLSQLSTVCLVFEWTPLFMYLQEIQNQTGAR